VIREVEVALVAVAAVVVEVFAVHYHHYAGNLQLYT
jgi:hypothetical protein